jgi:hypothetical protein
LPLALTCPLATASVHLSLPDASRSHRPAGHVLREPASRGLHRGADDGPRWLLGLT